MKKKTSRQELKKLVEKSIIRNEEKKRIHWSATAPVKEVLMSLESSYEGLDEIQIRRSRMIYGRNLVRSFFSFKDKQFCYVMRKQEEPASGIPRKDLVVGDIVCLAPGDTIPADLRVIEAKGLMVEQAFLTGDTKAVKKNGGICLCEMEKVTDYSNILLMGSRVIAGSGEAVVLSVGSRTIRATMS